MRLCDVCADVFFKSFRGIVLLVPAAAARSLDGDQSEIVTNRALLCSDSSIVPLGRARTHTCTQ